MQGSRVSAPPVSAPPDTITLDDISFDEAEVLSLILANVGSIDGIVLRTVNGALSALKNAGVTWQRVEESRRYVVCGSLTVTEKK